MDIDTAVNLARNATYVTLIIGAPPMLVAVLAGLFISILQAVTQIQEQTISFVPKLVLMLMVMLILLPWSIHQLMEYSLTLFHGIPALTRP